MEDDLKKLKLEYISNHWLDFPQILNLSLWDQTKIKNAWNKDDHWLDFPQILNLSLGDQSKIKNA